MRAVGILICLLSMLTAGAFALHQRDLLSPEVVGLYFPRQNQYEEHKPAPAPIGLAASVQKKQLELEQQRKETEQLNKRLQMQKQELQLHIEKMEMQLRTMQRIELETMPSLDQGQLVHLVKIYEAMEPEGAASILEKLPDDRVAQILLQMRNRQAAQVMESLSAGKGVAISARILPDQTKVVN